MPSIPPTNSQHKPSLDVQRQIRESLGLPPVQEVKPTLAMEGHVCEFPFWSFSKRRTNITQLFIRYDDGSCLVIRAFLGMPGTRFPGYMDVILHQAQRDLFANNTVHISVYSILQTLGIPTNNGRNYERFTRDIERAFVLALATDRFRNPETGMRSHVLHFRIFSTMSLAKNRREISAFTFNEVFMASLRSGYVKRLDWDFCLWLDREQKALARFFYGHLMKRIGEKSLYPRNLLGFLRDCGLGYIADLEPYRRNVKLNETVYPALDLLKGYALRSYEAQNQHLNHEPQTA